MAIAVALTACGPSPAREAGVGPAAIRGSVRLAESVAVPEPTTIANTTDPDQCGAVHTLVPVALDAATRGIRGALVVLERAAPGPMPPASASEDLRLANVGCRFEPAVAAVPVGTVLETVNEDEVLHTVHLYGPAERNLALPVRGSRARHRLERPGVYAVRCDLHGWMQAVVHVLETPWFALTDARGSYEIQAPPGTYAIRVWHESLGQIEDRLTVAGNSLRRDFEYSSE